MKSAPTDELIKWISAGILLLMVFALLIMSLSIGVDGQGAEPDTPMDSPIILSENQANKVLRLWSPPSTQTSVMYDQWEIIIFGNPNETAKLKINDFEAFNDTLGHSYRNISFDASRLTRAKVTLEIGNRSYQWVDIAINHQEIGYSGGGGVGESNLKFSDADIRSSSLKSAIGVVIASVLTIPFVWKGVKLWRNRQGVVQW